MGDWTVSTVVVGKVEKHPNADTLSIATIMGGYPVAIKSGELVEGMLATYVAVDTLVPIADERFKFLDTGRGRTHERVKAKKLRGVFSQGLLVSHCPGTIEGEDVSERLGCIKYVPPSEREVDSPINKAQRQSRRTETAAYERKAWATCIAAGVGALLCVFMVPGLATLMVAIATAGIALTYWLIRRNRTNSKRPHYAMYDIDSIRKWSHALYDGEDVVLTEKLHGSNASFVHTGKKFHLKSRTTFRGSSGGKGGWSGMGDFKFDDVWNGAAKKYDIERKLKMHPNMVLFGEIYGSKIQDLTYGCDPGETRFAAFDLYDLKLGKWLDYDHFREFCRKEEIPVVPEIYRGPWSSALVKMAEGQTTMPGAAHVREGFVVKPIVERHQPNLGRVQLKLAGEGYLTRKGQPED